MEFVLERPEPERDLLQGLNDAQRQAVTHETGPLLILAGPGSGKTRVITRRIAWLIEHGVGPEEIIAITFTNKAAKEMRERVATLRGPERIWISTFHSSCARILRREIELLGGYTRDFTIYDTADRTLLLKRLIKDAGYDRTRFRPNQVGAWISARKHKGYETKSTTLGGIEDEVGSAIAAKYETAMQEANALDFDDLLLKVLELFDREPGVRDVYARRFRHVMVDEYQDTNRVQYLLTRHLACAHGNLAVCGDPDQSIYAWRGADVRNILAFEEDHSDATVVRLEENYRSVNNILRAAQAVISNNAGRKEKDLWSERGDGSLLHLVECGDENDEGREIADQIRSYQVRGYSLSDMAIFYRANFQQRALETALSRAKIPYQIIGGVEFYARREIRDLIAYLKLALNPRDDVGFRRVVNVPQRGIGDKSVERLSQWAADRRLPLAEAARSTEAQALLRGRAKKGLATFAGVLEHMSDFRERGASDALEALVGAIDVEAWLAQMDDDSGVDRGANVDEFRAFAEEFDAREPEAGLRGFLEEISLVNDVDNYSEEGGGVTLMTLHSAKGLEFRLVCIAGLEEELLPHARSLSDFEGEDDRGLEEERRLFYVGLTRAKDVLVLTHAARRSYFGQESFRRPSRFVDELPPELIDGLCSDSEESVLGEFEAPDDGPVLVVGNRVEHDHFGRGTIERLQGSGINARASVRFPLHGTKELLLQYAKLRVL